MAKQSATEKLQQGTNQNAKIKIQNIPSGKMGEDSANNPGKHTQQTDKK